MHRVWRGAMHLAANVEAVVGLAILAGLAALIIRSIIDVF